MREILFKGKRICSGEWAEGFVARPFSRNAEGNITNYFFNALDEMGFVSECIVSAETICQYTGLTDKNGNKIWENDIVYIPYERLEDSYCKVVFRRGGFIGEMADGCEDSLLNRKAEVIGNIFDNPELLKGE